MDNAVANYTL